MAATTHDEKKNNITQSQEYDEYSETNIYGRTIKDTLKVKLIDFGSYFLIESDLDPLKDENVITILCISDTHGSHQQIKNMPFADILIHGGDFTDTGKLKDIKSYDKWIDNLINDKNEKRYDYSILIGGNHDITLEKDWYNKTGYMRFHRGIKEDIEECNEIIRNNENIIYLENECIEIYGLKFYGSPYQPEFCNWAFNLKRGKLLKDVWNKMYPNNGKDIDILITHTPPKYHGDKTSSGRWVGCDDLIEKILNIKTIKYHIFGHIHNGFGVTKNKNINTIFINASTLDSNYKCTNKPIMFYVKGDRSKNNVKYIKFNNNNNNNNNNDDCKIDSEDKQ